jgi:hypothetical protein
MAADLAHHHIFGLYIDRVGIKIGIIPIHKSVATLL